MNYEQELEALQLSVDLLISKLKVIDDLPIEQRDVLRKLVSSISMLPNRYKTGSVTPYYKERYARICKEQIADVMLADPERKPLHINALQMGKSRQTIQAMLFQGFQYLKEKLDTPDKKYANLRDQLEISVDVGGVTVRYREDKLAVSLKSDKSEQESWQDRLDKFLEVAREGETLSLEFSLTQEELEALKVQLSDISDRFVPLHVSDKKLELQRNEKLASFVFGGN